MIKSWMLWLISIIPALKKLKQIDYKSEANLRVSLTACLVDRQEKERKEGKKKEKNVDIGIVNYFLNRTPIVRK
jgi:hypothetical protein